MSQKPAVFGFSAESSLPYRIGFALVGVWWLGFAQITFRRMPQDNKESLPTGFIKSGYRELRHAFFYSAGVQTVIYLATIFAEQELAFSSGELILTVLILQIVAILGAYIFAKVAKAKGSKNTLILLIGIWVCICLGAYFTESKTIFYVIAAFVGLVLGGIQSTSRAGFTKLLKSDEDDLSSFYSFYDVLFYISVVFGTFAFGLVNQLTQSLRYSVLALVIFFVLAILFLAPMTFRDSRPQE
jgi:UMF1 family MFS transporter